MHVYIYALCEPNDARHVRYIGKTGNLSERYGGHISKALNYAQEGNYPKAHWIRELQRRGLSPVMDVLEICDENSWIEAERAWISYYRAVSDNLTNVADGGETGSRPVVDLSGCRFFRLLVQKHVGFTKHGNATWLCECDCGKLATINAGALVSGKTKSCGCYARERSRQNKRDLLGKTFGQLTVLEELSARSTDRKVRWLCGCTCGKTTVAIGKDLTGGNKVSCGCYRLNQLSRKLTKDLTGKRFHKLVVLGQEKRMPVKWLCRCDCGNSTSVLTGNLRNDGTGTKSCGCLRGRPPSTA